MTQVQCTNDNSIVSKLSSTRKGYFKDDFIHFFVDKYQNRSPLINRGYYIRFKAIENAFESLFQTLETLNIQNYQIISLGAGFDSSYFRLKSQHKLSSKCKYIEVDFPEVLLRKLNYIKLHKTLENLIENDVCSSKDKSKLILYSTNYVLLGVDMSNIENLHALCIEAEVNFILPTFLLSECSVTYMDVDKSRALITWVKNNFPNSSFVLYEQVYPTDGFGLIMKKHFLTLGSPLKSIDVYPDLISQKNRFLNVGWTSCYVEEMNTFYSSFCTDEKTRLQKLELFDEYETWHQKCSHYMLLCASQGLLTMNVPFNLTEIWKDDKVKYISSINFEVVDTCSSLHRFGHRICYFGNQNIFVTGGFGKCREKHQRLKGLFCYNLNTKKLQNIVIEGQNDKLGERMFHSMVCLKEGIYINGGRSAPSKPCEYSVLLYPSNDVARMKIDRNNSNDKKEQSIDLTKTTEIIFKCKLILHSGIIPSPRWRHTSSTLKVNEKDCVFLFGGCTINGQLENDCYLLDTLTWNWSEVPLQKYTPSKRHSHSSISSGDKVFVTGGLLQNECPTNCVYLFNADTLIWSKLDIKGLLPRYSHSSHIWKNYLFLVGGVNNLPNLNPFLAMIDILTFKAMEFSLPNQNPEYPIITCCHDSILCNDEIIIIGGGGNCFSFGTHFNTKLIKINLLSVEEITCIQNRV